MVFHVMPDCPHPVVHMLQFRHCLLHLGDLVLQYYLFCPSLLQRSQLLKCLEAEYYCQDQGQGKHGNQDVQERIFFIKNNGFPILCRNDKQGHQQIHQQPRSSREQVKKHFFSHPPFFPALITRRNSPDRYKKQKPLHRPLKRDGNIGYQTYRRDQPANWQPAAVCPMGQQRN